MCESEQGQAGASDLEFLLSLGIRSDIAAGISPRIISELKASERFQNAFAKAHKIFASLDDLGSSQAGVVGESEASHLKVRYDGSFFQDDCGFYRE